MAVSHGIRQQNRAGGRLLRKRRDSEEENVFLDFNRDGGELIQEILFNVVKQDVNISRKLGYLNGFVKLCMNHQNISELGTSYKEIFFCLRVPFFHEACEIRAAVLRACRYLLQNTDALNAFLETKLHFLVSRSLDILLDNRIERIQALRLMRKVLNIDPHGFPCAFTYCLVSIANEGSQERDMLRPCLATLAQLTLLNPSTTIKANGVKALLTNVIDNTHVQTSEAILGVIYFLINHPSTRMLMKDEFALENLLAPFTDCHYRSADTSESSTSDDKDPHVHSCKMAIVSTLLSWPGLIYLCRSNSSHVQSLIEMLYLPYPDLRKNILDLLYQIFDVPVPEWTDDFSAALSSSDPSAVKSSWQLYEGYVVAEGVDILPYSSNNRINLVHNYYGLLLLIFVQSGVLEANQFLPADCSHLSNCLPTLISSAAAFGSSKAQNQATAALTCLFRIHELKKRGPIPNSLVLSNILHMCNPDRGKKGFFVGTVSKIKLWKYLKQEMADGIDQAIKDTQVLSKDYLSWDWDLVDCILKNPSDSLKKLEDANHRIFLKKLLYFFKPSSKEFSEMEFDKDNGRQICITGCHFLEFFLELDENKSQEYLDDFLNDLNNCLIQLTKDADRLNSVLSPIKVSNTFSQMYFLFIGKLSSTHKGCKFLNRCNTFQNLLLLVTTTNQDVYIKLIISALDYTKEGFSRAILTKVLTGTDEATRLYATNFLLVLLRAKLPDYRKWAIEVLMYQVHDTSKVVSDAAMDILDEACTIQENLEALISLRSPLLPGGDKGLLLLMRFLSVRSGFKFLQDSNILYHEINHWQQVYNLKYVKIVEDLLNEAFTHHRRSDDGTYGRRSSDISHSVKNVNLPPHMYGQLAQHAEGFEVLESEQVLPELYNAIQYPNFSSEAGILQLKAALWAVGHVGSHSLGLASILKENIVYHIVKLAADAPVLSIRGTCYFILGLLCSTPEGASAVEEHGWEAIRRNHDEKWPLIKDEYLIEYSQYIRKSTWSFSSMSSEWHLGALPMNLSFVVPNSQFDLSRSQSESSCNSNSDVLQTSLSNKSFAGLKSSEDFDDPSSSDDARPRSSSDCQTEMKDNLLFQVAESSSWDALNTYSFSPPSNFNRYAKRRSISTSEVEAQTLELIGNSEESLEFNKQQDNSKASLTDVNVLSGPIRHSSETTNMFASDTSVSGSSKSSDICTERPSLLKQLSRGHSVYSKSSVSPDRPTSLLLTSARDALGYATLKEIQRSRVNSLSFQDSPSTDIDSSLQHLKSLSLDAHGIRSFNIAQNMFFHESEDDTLKSSNHHQDSGNSASEPRYIGLCLPSDLDFLFNVPKLYNKSTEDIQDVKLSDDLPCTLDVIFEFHTENNCFCNHSFNDKKCLQQIIIDEETEETSGKPVHCVNERLRMPLDRSNSLKGKSKEECQSSQNLIRKEAMRFVINLCSSVAVKASEQGLLNLKQKFPNAFQDICLYSEICFYMANYNFRLSARRFLQELFLDVTFEQLQWEAEAIAGIISMPQISTSEV
ncbi:rapamycin-insensitive companion of mTOR-like isoform X2 [Stegodyphus dumicola]|uniref:rapamycin-insensitive companion of mTOR-like isoform X2 n=1 Tax=Stegodyphus dumicola TaxID=202533 RepID=UPI0015AA0DCD|nr:rapamycin-insensitive companion of mTOR-like isoform X2 [Stegodyphus dumicola]